jgi:hypothetical protein
MSILKVVQKSDWRSQKYTIGIKAAVIFFFLLKNRFTKASSGTSHSTYSICYPERSFKKVDQASVQLIAMTDYKKETQLEGGDRKDEVQRLYQEAERKINLLMFLAGLIGVLPAYVVCALARQFPCYFKMPKKK